jgi:transposase-like protein
METPKPPREIEGSLERFLLTVFRLPKSQWKTLRTTTNVIERLHEEFRRR